MQDRSFFQQFFCSLSLSGGLNDQFGRVGSFPSPLKRRREGGERARRREEMYMAVREVGGGVRGRRGTVSPRQSSPSVPL